ncbi:TonB-dependent receptor [Gilvimarinus agarilyticus]|uniref:TonB-dependent receptor n=1 Tax=unclassified Gilvimarinus TaxID=2642066 RepID=UPI001C097D4F|nr:MULTISPECIES: TonB-dependent receptor [unclassified Gilvimarinus]MBU2887779.1 TonB-dependent receptor [Gilvimarinus agarilyticus]MDO6572418.1 TonB-dependent receptor [Gilvimarinus sp. 2_MG-2023]MDO6746562.1 TonB-dependent receptor [Gilvimarinus sp. 1_MG-2023]
MQTLKTKRRNASASLAIAVSIAAASYAGATIAQEQDGATQEQGQNTRAIEEVMVTAQKRSESAQDVAIAISAFSGEDLDKMGFEEGINITQQVPNMNYFAIFGEASSPSLTLRGIGLSNFADTWEAPVGLYVDEVYRGNPSGSGMQLFDVQRIEVLRGPQGTLFGRNTSAGLVHHITNDPTEDFEANASLQLGSYNQSIFEGAVSGALTDNVRGRFAVKKSDSDGWQTNGIDGQDLGTTDTLGYRGKLAIDFTDNVNLLLDVHGSDADQQTVGFVHLGYQDPTNTNNRCATASILEGDCISVTIPGALTGREEAGGWGPEYASSGAADGLKTEIETFGASAKLSITTDKFDITSITALETMDKLLEDDFDATSIIWFDEQYKADTEQFSQELRISGATDSMDWVSGIYYFKDERNLATQGPTTSDAIIFEGYWHNEYIDQNTESYAVFGQIDKALSNTLSLTVGARYTWEEKDAVLSNRGEPSYYGDQLFADEIDEEGFSGRLGLDYTPNDNTLYYASLSRGLKSGGFNGSYVGSVGAFGPVEKETMTSLEAGYKATLGGGRARLNVAVFAYELEDFQAQLWDSSTGSADISNLGDVHGHGLEAELTYLVTDDFELITGLGLLDTEIKSDLVTNVAGQVIEIDGNEMPSAPATSLNLVARYYLGDWTLQADYSWLGDHELQLENDPWSKQEAYGILNAQVSWRSGAWAVTGAVKNLLDEEYFTYQNTGGDDWGYAVWGAPQTAYVKLDYSF